MDRSNIDIKETVRDLNSPEIRKDDNIPFVDDFVELDLVKSDEPIRPKRIRDAEKGEVNDNTFNRDGTIHAGDLGEIHSSPDNDTIVVNTPEGTLYITLEPDRSKAASPSTESTDLSSPTNLKAFGAEESSALIQNEREMQARKASLRRNSISMPTLQNLELEVIKQQYLNNPQDEVSIIILVLFFY